MVGRLTAAQKTVLWQFSLGQTDDEIASCLHVDRSTVRKHIQNIGEEFFDLLSDPSRKRRTHRPELSKLLQNHAIIWRMMNSGTKSMGAVAPSYVDRPPVESIFQHTIAQPNALLRIKAPHLMGKTWLIDRGIEQANAQGYATASLSLRLVDQADFATLDRLLRWLGTTVSLELGVPDRVEADWDTDSGSKINCTRYFETYLLKQIPAPLVLCFDDVDILFDYPDVSEEFFGMLRVWHERANRRQIWQQLRLVLSYAAEVHLKPHVDQSPFNVGRCIELPEFTIDQIQTLFKQHELDWQLARIRQLDQLIGGHPYLLQQAIAHFKHDSTIELDSFLAEAPTHSGLYSAHLRRYLVTLKKQPILAAACKTLADADSPRPMNALLGHQLFSLGLAKYESQGWMMRCELYRAYFRRYLEIEEAR